MIRVGILGLGFIGQQHFAVWQDVEGAQVVAVADKEVERVAERAAAIGGNIGEQVELDLSGVARYTSLEALLEAGGIDVVDVCLPTFLHADATCQALAAGYHVICEKPMALNVEDCDRMIQAAEEAGKLLFIAQCIRFWPEYEVLAKMVEGGKLGRLRSLKFTRLSPRPTWSESSWIIKADLSGGALLDLHIHDVDFILSLLGMPPAVFAVCANIAPGAPKVDHVVAQYLYEDTVCVAEGGWDFPGSYPFEMAYEVIGEKGCLKFSSAADPALVFYPAEGDPYTPQYEPGTGYVREMEYFCRCIENNEQPERVTPFSARESVRVVKAEEKSINSGQIVSL